MSTTTPKVLLLSALVSAAAALLPEFLPEEWKTGLRTLLGAQYALVWTLAFLAVCAALLYFSWRDSRAAGGSATRNSITINGHRNQVRQNTGGGSTANEGIVTGDENDVTQG